MHGPSETAPPAVDATRLADRLRTRVAGEVRFDRLSRTLYSTDASIYEIAPLGVVMPRDIDDVAAVVEECRAAGASIVARGAGTGLTGGAVGPGVQLDLSRYMNRIGDFDAATRTVVVQPGVVLDELNAFLAPHGLQFAPDVATSSRATVGGMIANNSCGAHSVRYGRTVDHVREVTVVLSDGKLATFQGEPGNAANVAAVQRGTEIETRLGEIRDRYHDEIQRRFPKVMRSNGGYGLDRLGPRGAPADAVKVLCGSEGTLGVVASATLNLVPLPKHKGLAVLHFDSVAAALSATPAVLRHDPAAVELIDRLIIDAGLRNRAIGGGVGFLAEPPEAILVVEFFGDSPDAVTAQLDQLSADASVRGPTSGVSIRVDPDDQAAVWNLRTAGLGLLMSRPGDAQPYSFVEDTAVDPRRLREYIDRFAAILEREGVHAGFYAHASVGCIHVKPVLDLTHGAGVARMRRIAEAVLDLALEFGGTMTGEHGDGIVRSCWLDRLYGSQILAAFREVKSLFDPPGIMNPHKIVDAWPMTDHLRQGAGFRRAELKTYLDFSEHGGAAGLAGMCSGVGQCRQRLVGVMCPSYMATGDETHTTRARANALRVALSERASDGLLAGLDDPALDEVMDLCILCKACKTECPTGVDMARLKSEFLARRVLTHGADPRARFLADLPMRLKWAGRFPRLANMVAGSGLVRRRLERRLGLDARVRPPRLATCTFRRWFARRRRSPASPSGATTRTAGHGPSRGQVVYFVDTWTNYYVPQAGIAAVRLLERAGYEVLCPPTVCCGRPAISQGLLLEAKDLIEQNLTRLGPLASRGVPIVGTEPSCISTFMDESPRLADSPFAELVASRATMVETLLRRALDDDPQLAAELGSGGTDEPQNLLYHGHCHQKALLGTADVMAVLNHAFGGRAAEINSGCCGMAGSFGHEKEHYDIARAMGEQRLFPAVRDRGAAAVAVSGFSCRHQIEHHTGAEPRHWTELVAGTARPGWL